MDGVGAGPSRRGRWQRVYREFRIPRRADPARSQASRGFREVCEELIAAGSGPGESGWVAATGFATGVETAKKRYRDGWKGTLQGGRGDRAPPRLAACGTCAPGASGVWWERNRGGEGTTMATGGAAKDGSRPGRAAGVAPSIPGQSAGAPKSSRHPREGRRPEGARPALFAGLDSVTQRCLLRYGAAARPGASRGTPEPSR